MKPSKTGADMAEVILEKVKKIYADDGFVAWRIHLEPPSAIALRKTFSS